MANMALGLGFKGLIKKTIFHQFCGGESLEECREAIESLAASHIGTILDYSVEGEHTESGFDACADEILKTIALAKGDRDIPFSVFKVTGMARFGLLEKVDAKEELDRSEAQEWERVRKRIHRICKAAHDADVRIFVDAEESWIQDSIDLLAEEMMAEYNREKAIVYNTVQLYRHDRLAYMKKLIAEKEHYTGLKIVRGAYMEKERARAAELGYKDPIQPDKAGSDADYNEALEYSIRHLDNLAICAGTHNEESSMYLVELMQKAGLEPGDKRVYFSQLMGMSDHISFNLSAAGYNVAKYVPYGPVRAVIPYLTRRAMENSSVSGQVGRELSLIDKELKRRKAG